MAETFDLWLTRQMHQRGIRSLIRFAHEARVDPLRLSDWIIGRDKPNRPETAQLANYLGIPLDEVRQRATVAW